MRVTVIGARGQVARALADRASQEFSVTRLGRQTFDLETVQGAEHIIGATHPDVIVNAAAYTDVESAERTPDIAFRVNECGARKVAAAAATLAIPLIHLSTEYVFDGFQARPYTEADMPAPLNTYGHSKLAGEKAVEAETDDYVILRTSWLYSLHGRNFLTKIQAQFDTAEINVVADRRGAPTSAFELARGIEQICHNLVRSTNGATRGIFHMTCAGETTWAGFATEIVALTEQKGSIRPLVRPISSASLTELARRPINSCLNSDRLTRLHGVTLSDWKDALSVVIRQRKGAS